MTERIIDQGPIDHRLGSQMNPKVDHRPPQQWWADGEYICQCFRCKSYFIGDKRAGMCADCAYREPEDSEEVLELKREISHLKFKVHNLIQTLDFIAETGGREVETECGIINCTGSWCAEQARSELNSITKHKYEPEIRSTSHESHGTSTP